MLGRYSYFDLTARKQILMKTNEQFSFKSFCPLNLIYYKDCFLHWLTQTWQTILQLLSVIWALKEEAWTPLRWDGTTQRPWSDMT